MALTDGLRRKKTGRQAEQGTDNSGTVIHFRFPAGPRPAGAVSGEGPGGKGICLDAKYLRGKSSPTYIDKGRFVRANDNIILVDGENSGEVFTVPVDGYMGSTFKQLWLSTAMYKPYLLTFILFYKETLRNSKRGAAIPHLNKELFYTLPIGIPPYQEQERIAQRIDVLFQLLK